MTGNLLSPDTAVSPAHVTDRKQGFLLAPEKQTPTFFSFACVMHIVDNIKHSIFMNQDIHLLIWKTKALEELHAIDSRIFDYLTQPSLAETWADCTLSGARFGDLTSNNAETGQCLTVKLREQNVHQLLPAVVNMTASNFRERKEKAIALDVKDIETPVTIKGVKEAITKSKKLTGIVYDNAGESLVNSEDLKYQFTVDITIGHQEFAWPREENHVPSLRQMCICCGIIHIGYLCEHIAWIALHCNIDPSSIIMKWRTVEAYKQTYAPAAIVPKQCLPENDAELASLVNSEEGQARLQETLRYLNEGIPVETLPEGGVSPPSFMLHPPVTQKKRGRPVKKRKELGKEHGLSTILLRVNVASRYSLNPYTRRAQRWKENEDEAAIFDHTKFQSQRRYDERQQQKEKIPKRMIVIHFL
eukprot:g44298.t1